MSKQARFTTQNDSTESISMTGLPSFQVVSQGVHTHQMSFGTHRTFYSNGKKIGA
jgi:hypothetical protein